MCVVFCNGTCCAIINNQRNVKLILTVDFPTFFQERLDSFGFHNFEILCVITLGLLTFISESFSQHLFAISIRR